jgi:hypothetical protein
MRTLNVARGEIRVYETSQELASEAAKEFARLADQYVVSLGRFTAALSGGSTPRAMFSLLAEESFSKSVSWRRSTSFGAMSEPCHPLIRAATTGWLWKLCYQRRRCRLRTSFGFQPSSTITSARRANTRKQSGSFSWEEGLRGPLRSVPGRDSIWCFWGWDQTGTRPPCFLTPRAESFGSDRDGETTFRS